LKPRHVLRPRARSLCAIDAPVTGYKRKISGKRPPRNRAAAKTPPRIYTSPGPARTPHAPPQSAASATAQPKLSSGPHCRTEFLNVKNEVPRMGSKDIHGWDALAAAVMSMPGATKFPPTTGSMTTMGSTTIQTRISARPRDHSIVIL